MEFFLDEFVLLDMCIYLYVSDKERCKLVLNSVFFGVLSDFYDVVYLV